MVWVWCGVGDGVRWVMVWVRGGGWCGCTRWPGDGIGIWCEVSDGVGVRWGMVWV